MRNYTITIQVDDPDVSEKTLRWLLNEAGEVTSVRETLAEIPAPVSAREVIENQYKDEKFF